MKIFLFFFFFFISLYAKNPTAFKEFGDSIYENAMKFEKFQQVLSSKKMQEEMKFYLQELQKVKKFGNTLSLKDEKAKEKYFQLLRNLARKNDFYKEKAEEMFENALEKNDLEFFSKILQTGLIDFQRNEEKILTFYKHHKKELVPDDFYVDELDDYKKLFKDIMKNKDNSFEALQIKDLQNQLKIQERLEAAIKKLSKEN